MKFKISRKVIQFIGSIIGFILLAYQILKSFSAINKNIIPDFNIWMLFLSLLFAFFALIFQILGWLSINKSLGYNFPLKNIFFGYTFTFLPRYVPGSIWGYLTRSEWLLRDYKIPYHDSLFVSSVEMGMIFLVNILLGSYFLPTSTTKTFGTLIFFLLLLFLIPLKNFFTNFPKIKYYTELFYKINIVSWIYILSSFLLSWFLYGIGLKFTMQAYSISSNFDLSSILLITSINSISWLLGFIIIFIPAGIGIRELFLNYLLINTFLIPPGISSSIAVSYRLISLLAELFLLVIGFLILGNHPIKSE